MNQLFASPSRSNTQISISGVLAYFVLGWESNWRSDIMVAQCWEPEWQRKEIDGVFFLNLLWISMTCRHIIHIIHDISCGESQIHHMFEGRSWPREGVLWGSKFATSHSVTLTCRHDAWSERCWAQLPGLVLVYRYRCSSRGGTRSPVDHIDQWRDTHESHLSNVWIMWNEWFE